jgi:hypothetical protein
MKGKGTVSIAPPYMASLYSAMQQIRSVLPKMRNLAVRNNQYYTRQRFMKQTAAILSAMMENSPLGQGLSLAVRDCDWYSLEYPVLRRSD